METESQLKAVRERRGISAAELARRVGVTRQTIYAMEAGSYVPNTTIALQLARALEVSVEELFRLESQAATPTPVKADLLLTGKPPVAGQPLRLCMVNRKLVAVPSAFQPVYLPPADGIVSAYKPGSDLVDAEVFHGSEPDEKRLLVAGCDPGISVVGQHLLEAGHIDLVPAPCPSRQALTWLKEGKIHVAGSHLRDAATGEYNLPIIRKLFPRASAQVVTFATWEEGFVVARGNPKGIRTAADLTRRDVVIVNRELGAGSRELLDRLLTEAGIDRKKVRGYSTLAPGHLPAAWRVYAGEVDCCVATRLAARALGLDFIPLATERYDLVTLRRYSSLPAVEAMFDALNRSSLRRKLEALAGYDTSETGESRG